METDQDPDEPITERKRLEASALVASRVSSTAVRRADVRSMVRDLIIGVLVVAVAVLGIRALSENSRTNDAVRKGNQTNCQLFKDAGTTETTEQTTIVGLRLLADFRNSYYRNDCQEIYGKLSKPDSRIVQYLDREAK